MATNVISEFPGISTKGFKVHDLPKYVSTQVSRGRRDFYKMGLLSGDVTIYYGDKFLETNDTVLFFINPKVTHSVVRLSKKTTGYTCLFNESFIKSRVPARILKNSPLFHIGDSPIIPLNGDQAQFMSSIFQKMLAVYNGDFHYSEELVSSCIELIIYEAMRIQPSRKSSRFENAATRITYLFMNLLEKQFPIGRSAEPLRLKTAFDFALDLSVHVNYLNRAIKEITGKPTSAHISERITDEAKSLLQHTDWSVADIAHTLGFEYPTYFNNFFKRMTGTTPNSLRNEKV